MQNIHNSRVRSLIHTSTLLNKRYIVPSLNIQKTKH